MDALIEMYGESIIDNLRSQATEIRKFSIPELEEMEEEFKRRTKDLLKDQSSLT